MVKKKRSLSADEEGIKKGSAKNNISIILGGLSILISFLVPYAVAITGIVGIIFAYVEKGKVSKKTNLWAFVLNAIGLFLAIVFLTLSLIALILLNGTEIAIGGA